MAVKKGMDISVFQGDISWSKVTGIEFAIIRAGYGSNNIDSKALQNIKGCTDRKIPFGFYWFSYALSVNDAVKEADYVCNMADKYKITFPVIGYDWEYDSDNYAAKCNVSITNDKRYQFAVAFLNRNRLITDSRRDLFGNIFAVSRSAEIDYHPDASLHFLFPDKLILRFG